jgi:2-oxoglutarate ferredoxin oxidoreductase subunit alpha
LLHTGLCPGFARNAVQMLRDQGIKAGLIRPISLWPFPTEIISKRAESVKTMITCELSLGQMHEDVRLAVNGKCPTDLVFRVGGIVPSPQEVVDEVIAKYKALD